MNKCNLVKECKLLNLRDRQILTVVKTFNRLKFYNKLLIVAGTGYGKTYVFMCTMYLLLKFNIIKGRVLIVTNRVLLIDQIRESFKKLLNIDLQHLTTKDISIADYMIVTVQTYTILKDREQIPSFSLLILDEAHFTCSNSYKDLISHIKFISPECVVLGYTATPIRADGVSLMTNFECIADEIQLGDLVDKNLLTRCSLHTKYISDEFIFFEKVYNYFKDFRDKVKIPLKTIFYCGSIKECEKLYKLMKDHERVGLVHHGTKVDKILADFKNGVIDIIINVKVLVEGFDCPDVNCIVICKTINHLGTLIQMVGRGARLNSDKDIYYCLDLKDNFKSLNPEDVNFLEHISDDLDINIEVLDFVGSKQKYLGYAQTVEIQHNVCPKCSEKLDKELYCYMCLADLLKIKSIYIKPKFNESGQIVSLLSKGTTNPNYLLTNIMMKYKTIINRNPNYLVLNKEKTILLGVYFIEDGKKKRSVGTYLYVYIETIKNYQVIVIKTDNNTLTYTIVIDQTLPNVNMKSILNLLNMIDLLYCPVPHDLLSQRDKKNFTSKIEEELSCFDLSDKKIKRVVINHSAFFFKIVKLMKRLIINGGVI